MSNATGAARPSASFTACKGNRDMRYLCLVHLDGTQMAALTPEEGAALNRESMAYDAELARRGVLLHAEALQDPKSAVIVRARQGRVSTTDGPFAETKEHLGGFILIEARDLNEAIAVAADIPVGRYGAIEVRPVMEFG
jgi:hypothetical protein